jgi:hypothetical protein
MKTIFFSWQSDIPPVRNKLQKALRIVVKDLGNSLEEADRPELDSDTRGTYGSEQILATILSKIEACILFVADVTPIISTDKKMIPNPNVMIELGYALRAKGPRTRLYVFCRDSQVEVDIEKMPFDIRVNQLFGFGIKETPTDIAKRLEPVLKGMLDVQADVRDNGEYPYIYVDGGSFHNAADASYTLLNIHNSEDKEYQLVAIEVEGKSSEPFRALLPQATTTGISIMGINQVFQSERPLIHFTVERKGKKYTLEQKIHAPQGDDGLFHFARFENSSTLIPN